MPRTYRQLLITIITFVSGLYFFIEFLLPEEMAGFKFSRYHEHISRGFATVGAMAFALGIINILRVHGGVLLRARRGSLNSLALILGLFVMLFLEGGGFIQQEQQVESWNRLTTLGQFSDRIKQGPPEEAPEKLQALERALAELQDDAEQGRAFLAFGGESEAEQRIGKNLKDALAESQTALQALAAGYPFADPALRTASHGRLEAALKTASEHARDISQLKLQATKVRSLVQILREGFFLPLGAAMFSLLAFYIATAAYRSFRIRSWEAFVMMLAALLVILGQIPQGPLYISDGLPQLRLWLLKNLSTPAFRAIFFGSAVAGLAMAIRMWLSLEKSPLGMEDEG